MQAVEAEQAQAVDPKVLQITDQYRLVGGRLEEMFQAARTRTNGESWRRDGVGSCKLIDDYEASEGGLKGAAKEYIIALRDVRNQQAPGRAEQTDCPYHRTGMGCVLRELKAPICIQHFDNG